MTTEKTVSLPHHSPNTVWHQPQVSRDHRRRITCHRSVNLWFTGLSGSGKSTLAHAVEKRLHEMNCHTYVFDGDNVRHGLCADLGFSLEERRENMRRIAEMVKLFLDAGVLALTAFISPLEKDRDMVREIIGDDLLIIYCKCPLEVCERRDVKGMYKKAREGKIAQYTGISSPYEEPADAALVVDTAAQSLEESVEEVIRLLIERMVIEPLELSNKFAAAG